MKRILILFIAVAALVGCERDQIQKYDLGRYVTFGEKERRDSTISFSLYAATNEMTLRFAVQMMGNLLAEDATFALEVDREKTTADAKLYTVDLAPKFRKNSEADSISIIIRNDESLKSKDAVLVLNIVDNANFLRGFKEYSTLTVRFNDKAVQPLWWTSTFSIYFGPYNEPKLRAMAAFFDLSNFGSLSEPEIQRNARLFKAHDKDNEFNIPG